MEEAEKKYLVSWSLKNPHSRARGRAWFINVGEYKRPKQMQEETGWILLDVGERKIPKQIHEKVALPPNIEEHKPKQLQILDLETEYRFPEQFLFHQKVNDILELNKKIAKDISEIKFDVRTSKDLLIKALTNYPIEMTKIISILFGGASFLALLLGKMFGRIILAPDIGIIIIIMSITFWNVANIKSKNKL
jgi:hypothetical protein